MQQQEQSKKIQKETKKSKRQMQPHYPTRGVIAAVANVLSSLEDSPTLDEIFAPANTEKRTKARIPISVIYRTRSYVRAENELEVERKQRIAAEKRKSRFRPITVVYMTRQRSRNQEIIERELERNNSNEESDNNLEIRLEIESETPQHGEYDYCNGNSMIIGQETPKYKKPLFLMFPALNYRELGLDFWELVECFVDQSYWSRHLVSSDENQIQIAVFLRGEENYPEDGIVVNGCFERITDEKESTRVKDGIYYKDEYVFRQTKRFKKTRMELLKDFENGLIKSII